MPRWPSYNGKMTKCIRQPTEELSYEAGLTASQQLPLAHGGLGLQTLKSLHDIRRTRCRVSLRVQRYFFLVCQNVPVSAINRPAAKRVKRACCCFAVFASAATVASCLLLLLLLLLLLAVAACYCFCPCLCPCLCCCLLLLPLLLLLLLLLLLAAAAAAAACCCLPAAAATVTCRYILLLAVFAVCCCLRIAARCSLLAARCLHSPMESAASVACSCRCRSTTASVARAASRSYRRALALHDKQAAPGVDGQNTGGGGGVRCTPYGMQKGPWWGVIRAFEATRDVYGRQRLQAYQAYVRHQVRSPLNYDGIVAYIWSQRISFQADTKLSHCSYMHQLAAICPCFTIYT